MVDIIIYILIVVIMYSDSRAHHKLEKRIESLESK